jgi:protein-tyrosine phosphatase
MAFELPYNGPRRRGATPDLASAGQRVSTEDMTPIRLSFVCLGNICRSPLAQGVFEHLVAASGRSGDFEIESAGIGSWHVGEAPDHRALATAKAHGLTLTGRVQQVKPHDFARFEMLIALDSNLADELRRLAPTLADRAKVRLLREFDPLVTGQSPATRRSGTLDVPDPYYGGPAGFEDAYQMIEQACRGLLETLQPAA